MKNKIKYIALALLILIGLTAFTYHQKIYGPSVIKDSQILITKNDSFEDLKTKLANFIHNPNNFDFVADLKKFSKPKIGSYVLKKGMSNNDLVNMLRIGNQTPIKISFNNQDTLEKLSGRIAAQIQADSISILTCFKEPSFLQKNGFTEKSALGMYIPNQYEVYWNTSPEKLKLKMLKQYNRFWNTKRLNKAKQLNLTKEQVITLASIVQKETAQQKERPTVAGLYLNRYKNSWPLQADPTVIFALKEKYGHNTVIKRVLTKDLAIESPYNTYRQKGLPPTLIAMPDVSAIEAVLNPQQHNYFYMCASVDNIGFHEFAKTLNQHNANARKYQKWINKRGINR